jgi:hypothetical protein
LEFPQAQMLGVKPAPAFLFLSCYFSSRTDGGVAAHFLLFVFVCS